MREQRGGGGGGGTDKVSFQRILGGISGGRERSERKIVLKDEKLDWLYTIYILFFMKVNGCLNVSQTTEPFY